MKSLSAFMFLFVVCSQLTADAAARVWTSATGGYKLEAELIGRSDTDLVLKRKGGKLVAVRIDELSEADRAFIQSKEADVDIRSSVEKMQTWTSVDGLKIRGRVLAFGRKDYTLTRRLGKIVLNDTPFAKLDDLHQRLLLKVMSKLESKELNSEAQLNQWALSIAGQPKTFTLEGVLMELESGDQIPVPFFLFSKDDLKVLQPGWEAWSKADQDEQARQRESLMMQTEAREYQQQKAQQDYQQQQVEYLRLNLLAAATGVTSIWEVGLSPPPGVWGRPTSVMVTAQNSAFATNMAMAQYPGYQVIGVRRASR